MRGMVRLLVGAVVLLGLVSGCAAEPASEPSVSRSDSPSVSPSPGGGTGSGTREPTPEQSPPRESETTPPERWTRVRERGIDASHHQGEIDWAAVAGDDIAFAYLKATEGTGFTDPRFAANRAAAQAEGLEVGGYHYFQLCSPGADQADHFAPVVGRLDGALDLPGAIDLELAGSCGDPPQRETLLTEVRTFLERVEERTGKRPIVYLYPEFEEHYGLAADLSGYRQWVRSLDGRPGREWWIWQRSQTATVAGIDGPTDLNLRIRRQRVE